MPMGPWRDARTDAPKEAGGVFVTRAEGEWFDHWRVRIGLFVWSKPFWTKAGALQAKSDFDAEQMTLPRSNRMVLRWREEL